MALELNEDGYSIAALMDAQKQSLKGEKDASASTQIKNMLSKVDLKALGKSLHNKSPLAQKADNLNKALNGETKYTTIAIPTGYDPFVHGDAAVVNSIGINPSYIDVEAVDAREGDIEVLNPNNVFKNTEPIIIRGDDIQATDDSIVRQGYQAYSVSTKGRIGKSQGTTIPIDIEDVIFQAEETVKEDVAIDTSVVKDDNIVGPQQIDDVFNVGSDIHIRRIDEVFDTTAIDEDFENLTNMIASSMLVVDEIRRLRGAEQPQSVAQG